MKHIILTFALLLAALTLYGQEESYKPLVIPPSPNVSSLNKFIEVPVGHYTGLPNVTIPIWELKGNKISMPISISHHASGIRVEDIPGWVGQNWSLNAGGTISRTMMGKADEKTGGYFTTGDEIPDPTSDPTLLYGWQPGNSWLTNVANGVIDSEPDIFYYSFNGQSGKFVFSIDTNGNRQILPIPYAKLDFSEIFDVSGTIIKWIVKDQAGTQYIFGKSEDGLRTAIEQTYCEETDYISSWHLMDIISSSGDDQIKFYYIQSGETYDLRISETKFNYYSYDGIGSSNCQGDHSSYNNSQISINTYKLDKIESSGQTVIFNSSDDRLDFDGLKLDSIEIKDQSGIVRRSFAFSYGYFSVGSRTLDKRLRLDQIMEKGDNNESLPPYVFSYNVMAPPARDSYAQDWWGYYNGKNSNSTLVPKVTGPYPLPGANREPDTTTAGSYLKAGSLEQITYPTGGTTLFEYEPHDYGFIKNQPVINQVTTSLYRTVLANNISTPDYISDGELINIDHPQYVEISYTLQDNTNEQEGLDASIELQDFYGSVLLRIESAGTGTQPCFIADTGSYFIIAKANLEQLASARIDYEEIPDVELEKVTRAGGLRIKRITETTDSLSIIREFSYRLQSDNDYSSGSLASALPIFNFNYYVPQFDSGNEIPLFKGYCIYKARSSSPQSLSGLTSGSHIGYAEVTEKIGLDASNGKIHYKFISSIDSPDSQTLVFPFPPVISKDWHRGLLKEKTIYDSNDTIIQKQENYYSIYNSTGDPNRRSVPGIKAAYSKRSSFYDLCDEIKFEPYEIVSGWYNLNKTINISYNPEGNIVQGKYYYYNSDHLQLTREVSNNSLGKYDQIFYFYPPDYPTGTNTVTSTFDTMVSKNMISPVIKKETFTNGIKSGDTVSGASFGEGVISNYKPVNNFIVPSSIDIAKTNNSYETKISFDYYTSKGQIAEYHESNGTRVSYLWGYNQMLPVCEVNNAENSKICFTGFEVANEYGGWTYQSGTPLTTYSKTGKISCINAIMQKTVSVNSIISLWSKGSGIPIISLYTPRTYSGSDGWTYYEWLVTPGTVTVYCSNCYIDDLRLYPVGAMMTTYTYDPLVGMTSKTDSNGTTIYYEYDSLGRLMYIRDYNHMILKFFRYNYKD